MRILFQGDSITDCGRDRGDDTIPCPGYAGKVAGYLSLFHRGEYEVLNRGVSGDDTGHLLARWETDCLALEPGLLSLLVGINDCHNKVKLQSTADFAGNYQSLLEQVRARLPKTRILLMEPFLLPTDPEKEYWREDLNAKKDFVKRMAREYHTAFLPLDGIFAAACAKREPAYWSEDGVHPTDAGHALIARYWLEEVL